MNIHEIRAAAERAKLLWRNSPEHVKAREQCRLLGELADHVLTHPFGVLKPLEWRQHQFSGTWMAEFFVSSYEVRQTVDGPRYWINGAVSQCASVEDGKSICQSHYASEMAKAFTTIGEQS